MQYLYGMIRGIQLIIMTSLISIVYPPEAQFFNQEVMIIASIDIFSAENLYEEYFDLRET